MTDILVNLTVQPESQTLPTPISEWEKDGMTCPMHTGKSGRGIIVVVDDVCVWPVGVANIIVRLFELPHR